MFLTENPVNDLRSHLSSADCVASFFNQVGGKVSTSVPMSVFELLLASRLSRSSEPIFRPSHLKGTDTTWRHKRQKSERWRETEVSGLAVSKLTPPRCSSDVANLSPTGFAFTLKHRLKQACAL